MSHDNASCGITLYRVSSNVALTSRARTKFQPSYIDRTESDTLSQNIKGVAVWRRDPGRETEGYYIFSHRLSKYWPIHYIEEDHLWVYIAVDEANKWYTIKPVPLGLGVGPTRTPAVPIDIDQPEDPPAEGSQNTGTIFLAMVPPADPTTTITITQPPIATMSTVTTTITQPTGKSPSGTATIPSRSGGGGGGGGGRGRGGGGGGGGRGLPAGAPPAGRAAPLHGKLGGNPPAEFDGNREKS